jgi:hypothetical protein
MIVSSGSNDISSKRPLALLKGELRYVMIKGTRRSTHETLWF